MDRFFAALTTIFLLLGAGVGAAAQPRPAFEVVSIKPVPRPTPETVADGTSRIGVNINEARVEIVGYGASALIARAFRVEIQQVDLRGFGSAEVFEVQATIPAGAAPAQVPEMLQTMLAERFKLAYHREMREYPVTVVTVGKNGMKLRRLPDGTQESSKSERLGNGGTRTTSVGTVSSFFPVMNSFGKFAQMIDQTGLDGMYAWVRDTPPTSANVDFFAATHEGFEAMFEAAGLRLEARTVAKDTIVVDRLEKMPTEN